MTETSEDSNQSINPCSRVRVLTFLYIGSLGFIQGLCKKGSDQTVQTD